MPIQLVQSEQDVDVELEDVGSVVGPTTPAFPGYSLLFTFEGRNTDIKLSSTYLLMDPRLGLGILFYKELLLVLLNLKLSNEVYLQ